MNGMITLGAFLRDTYGSTHPDLSQIFSPTKTLKVKGEIGIDWHVLHGKISGDVVPIEHLPLVVGEINQRLQQAIINCTNPERHYFVCFDELDLGFSLDSVEYRNQLTGLLIAARRINNQARLAGKNLSVVIFLRDDIYNMLHFEDKNKITVSAVSVIEWDVAKDGPSLKSLMEKRFHETLGISESGSWDEVFDETREMSGHQTKYRHVLDRTFLRPRDIIYFANEILQAHRANQDAESVKFDNKDVIAARNEYSKYLLNELDDEIKKHHPDYKVYLEVFRTIGSLNFTLEDVESARRERANLVPPDLSSRDMLSRLFEFSVIGFYRPGGAGFGGADYVWRHKDRKAMFNDNAINYRVHPGLMEVLGLKKFTKSS